MKFTYYVDFRDKLEVADDAKATTKEEAEANKCYDISFDCEKDDAQTAYEILAESCAFTGKAASDEDVADKERADMEDTPDDTVDMMLDALEKLNFIAGWEKKKVEDD